MNTAGNMLKKPLAEVEEYDQMFDTHAKAAFFCMREAARRMEDGGRIVNLSTTITSTTVPMYSVYAGAKTATAGRFVFASRGTPHTFANLSGREAQVPIVCIPAGFERYFLGLAAQLAGVDPPPEARLPRPETRHVGPPIGKEV